MVLSWPSTRIFSAVAAFAVLCVVLALVSQHVFDMQPCAWCVLQRLIFLAIAAAAVLGMAWRARAGTLATALSLELLAMLGIAAALWQNQVAAASSSCKLTLAEKIIASLKLDALAPEVFEARASCADAAATLVGVPYEIWSLMAFVVISTMASAAMLKALRER